MLCLGKSLVVILNYALTAGPLWSRALLSRQTAPDPLPTWGGSGDATCPGGGSPQPKQLGPRTSQGVPDPRRVPDPHILSDTLPGLVRSPHVSAGVGTRAEPRGFHWKTRLPTAFNAVGGSALCHSRARGGFCQVALLVACYQDAQCSRQRRPRRVCQSTMPVGHDVSASPIMTPTR